MKTFFLCLKQIRLSVLSLKNLNTIFLIQILLTIWIKYLYSLLGYVICVYPLCSHHTDIFGIKIYILSDICIY